ncbi:hypothetical protein HYU40_04355 [Candidatus Woesearchaeota archaeon]|nr:hypothetical protein [Candidatus Woesearchaeota archaeon]
MGKKAKSSSSKSRGSLAGTTVVRKSVYRSPNTTTLEILVKKIGEAPHDKRFVLKDGRVLKDLVELSHALDHMSDEVFNHHVNASKNDFRNWVRDVFSQKELVVELEKAKTRNDLQLAVLKHIVRETFS